MRNEAAPVFELFVSDALRFAHLLAVAIGFGVAVETEVYIARRRRTAISPGLLSGLGHRHRVILAALAAMWVTGLALVALRTGFQLADVTPKLWAKIIVVTILSVNAVFVSEIALPILAAHRGRRIGALAPPMRRALFSVAGISAASWLVAFLLGASAILKVAPASVFQTALPLAYVAGILGANIVGIRLFAPTPAAASPARQPRPLAAPRHAPGRPASPVTAPTDELGHDAHPVPGPAPNPAPQENPARSPAPKRKRAIARRAPAEAGPRASDLAIAFPPKPGRGGRLKPGPAENPAHLAARERLAEIAADLVGQAQTSPASSKRPIRGTTGRGPMCEITSAAATQPIRPQVSRSRPVTRP